MEKRIEKCRECKKKKDLSRFVIMCDECAFKSFDQAGQPPLEMPIAMKITADPEEEKYRPRPLEDAEKARYGKHEEHFIWDLTESFLTMSNDAFFDYYGFNYVPIQGIQNRVRGHLDGSFPMKYAIRDPYRVVGSELSKWINQTSTVGRINGNTIGGGIKNGMRGG